MNGLAQLTPGAPFEGVFAVRDVERRLSRAGKPFLSVVLADATGSARGVIFDQPDWFAERLTPGAPVRVAGRAEQRGGRLELLISHVRPADEETADAQLVPRSHRDPDELFGFVLHLADEVADPGLRRTLERLTGDDALTAAWRQVPCTRSGHHAYIGGLVEHTVGVAALCQTLCTWHPRIDSDLLVTAALVHDLGYTRAWRVAATFETTEEGRLLGHVALGLEIVAGRRRQSRARGRAAAGAAALRGLAPRAAAASQPAAGESGGAGADAPQCGRGAGQIAPRRPGRGRRAALAAAGDEAASTSYAAPRHAVRDANPAIPQPLGSSNTHKTEGIYGIKPARRLAHCAVPVPHPDKEPSRWLPTTSLPADAHGDAPSGRTGTLENPEVHENVPGHVIPILEREFDDFDTEATRFLGGERPEDQFIGFRLQQGVYGQRQPDVQMVRVKIPFGGVNPEQLEMFADCRRALGAAAQGPHHDAPVRPAASHPAVGRQPS